jgi:hypothetical protein
MKPWQRFTYVLDINDVTIDVKRGVLTPQEVQAACNATIILSRMIRKGRNAYNERRSS